MILVNGKQSDCIAISNRGFQYGDGLFETIEVRNGTPVFFDQHLKRLRTGCERLNIPYPDVEILAKEVQLSIQNSKNAVLKIIVTHGSGGRGYLRPENTESIRVISLHPFPDYPDLYKQKGIKLRFCRLRLGHNPYLAGLKHLNRLEQVMARSEWHDNSFQEGLMLDFESHVIEGTMSNLFLVKKGALYTPRLNKCGIDGILRQIIIRLATENGIKLVETVLTTKDVLTADEVFVTNSIIGIWPVKSLEHRSFSENCLSGKFSQWLKDYKTYYN